MNGSSLASDVRRVVFELLEPREGSLNHAQFVVDKLCYTAPSNHTFLALELLPKPRTMGSKLLKGRAVLQGEVAFNDQTNSL